MGLLARALPALTFTLTTLCLDDSSIQTYRLFGRKVQKWTLPEQLAAVPTARLAALISQVSRGRFGPPKARVLQKAAPHSIGVRRGADRQAAPARCAARGSSASDPDWND